MEKALIIIMEVKYINPNEWEQRFVRDMVTRRDENRLTGLTERQVTSLQNLHDKHFA